MRYALIVLWMMLGSLTPAVAQVSINFSTPGVNIGINLPVYPQLQRVPGYPVYYAPNVSSNYFFFDGLYWVFEDDGWYESSWYNGPWRMVDPMYVPVYLLRVPVRYYRRAPVYFRGWRATEPPRWGEHWGPSWTQRRSGWDQWNRNAMPAPAPLPTYQRQYSGNRYPHPEQQAVLQSRSYRYQPRDTVAQEHFQHQRTQAQQVAPTPPTRQAPAPRLQPSQQPSQLPSRQVGPQSSEPRGQPPRAERQAAQPPAAREPPPSRQPATDNAPPGKQQSRDQGRGKDNRDNKDNKDRDEKEPKERGRDR
ncbi:MAG: hypothetical protein ABI790_05795 [Betaproteobacteria bacterium]